MGYAVEVDGAESRAEGAEDGELAEDDGGLEVGRSDFGPLAEERRERGQGVGGGDDFRDFVVVADDF